MTADTAFELACEALEQLTAADVPDPARPYAVVHAGTEPAWFESFADAGAFARSHFAPETYAIGRPGAPRDFLPLFIVTQPLA